MPLLYNNNNCDNFNILLLRDVACKSSSFFVQSNLFPCVELKVYINARERVLHFKSTLKNSRESSQIKRLIAAIDGSTDRCCIAIVTNERALLSGSDQPVQNLGRHRILHARRVNKRPKTATFAQRNMVHC